jgi:two-component system CheB/CheR fusion protein
MKKRRQSRAGRPKSTSPSVKSRGNARVVAKKPAVMAASAKSRAAKGAPTIVGIGASAGGLEAFTQLLRALATNTGMAFVLVQHLEPKHQSILADLLANATEMPVQEVREGMRAEPNHVYVIPANADLSLMNGLLHLAGRRAPAGHHLPIDYFFQSLAEARQTRAVGVILSGTASDGTAGLKAIKVAGGITFAQQPESASFDGMPRSAIASGCVDLVLPPDQIATELARIGRHPLLPFAGTAALEGAQKLPAREEDWARLFTLLHSAHRVGFTFYRRSTIERRVARRMALHKLESMRDYLRFAERDPKELDALFEDILIHVTGFFREREVFAALQKQVLPALLAAKPAGEPFRIWVAGCSTGEEAYSIAICLLESMGQRAAGIPIQIFATDVSDAAIEKARAGVYPEVEFREVAPERLRRFFTRVNGHYEVNKTLREICVFARHDVTKDPPFSKLDLVSCRNLLIYFEPVLQKKVLARFHYALKSNGVLLLGKSESVASTDLFTPTDRKLKVFTKNPAASISFEALHTMHEMLAPRGNGQNRGGPPGLDLEKEADRIVWERYTHGGLVVNNELQILHYRGDTSPYLKPIPGKATLNLLKMVREDLQLELRAAIQTARRTGSSVRREAVRFQHDQEMRAVNLEIRPLPAADGQGRCFLILFEDASVPSRPRALKPAVRKAKEPTTGNKEVRRLQNELARTREYLQAVIRDQESTNEELKTTNEEALSSMEELQSTNEELETAKEELQSSNEELVTLNEQLQNTNTELGHLSDDLNNVLSGVEIPVVILDGERRIRRFTAPAQKLFGLVPDDIGRPLGDLRFGISIRDVKELISAATATAGEVQQEIQSEDGHWYSLRIHPFQTREHKIEGVLMAFVDIHDLKQHQAALQKDRNLIASILEVAEALLVMILDPDGKIVEFNHACRQLTGYSLEEVKGAHLWDFLLAPQDGAAMRTTFKEMVGGVSQHRESYLVTKSGAHRLIAWFNNSVVGKQGTVESVIFTGIDQTERAEAQQRAQEGEANVRRLLATVISAQEGERRELAREIHDVFSQQLAAVGMEISTLAQSVEIPGLTERLAELSKKLGVLADDLHRTSRQLHPAILNELGLASALREECAAFERQFGIPVRFTSTDLPASFPEDISLCLYRVAQESLRNIREHTGATMVQVSLKGGDEEVRLRVEDTGDGFDVNEARKSGGLGLISMEERVNFVNGKFTIDSKPGTGTVVEVSVPLNRK